jgi:hypothetical protein
VTEDGTEPVPEADPSNAPPEEWLGEPVGLEAEQEMIDAALAADVRDQPYDSGVPGGL